MPALRALVVGAALAGAVPAAAQSSCSGLADGRVRLECYDRTARTPASAPRAPQPALSGVCTPSSPCVGPRGGVYYIAPSGHRRYLPRG